MKKIIFLSILLSAVLQNSYGYDWTYFVSVSNNSGGAKKQFYLWLPANAKGVKGVIMTAKGRISQLSGDSTIRKACAEAEIGIMGCMDLDGSFAIADTQYINNALNAFALQSKLPELANIPLGSYGTSVGGIFAWEVAYAYRGRFFAIIQDNAIYTKRPSWANPTARITDVPFIVSRGYNEPVGDRPSFSIDSVLYQRTWGSPSNLILKAGLGHFSWTNWEANYLAKWIKKAAMARIPAGYARTGKPNLLTINEENGLLTDTNFTSSPIASASFADYAGDKTKAFWHFDQEMADLWISMHDSQFAKTPQLGQFGNSTFDNCQNPWAPCPPNLNLSNGIVNPLAITNASLPIRYGVYNGPFRIEQNNSISLDPTLIDEGSKGWLVAIQEGDSTHQGWERALQFIVDKKTSGQDQTISFTSIPDKLDTDGPISVTTTSTSGLNITTRIKSGPAEIVGNQIILKPFAGDSLAKATVIVRYGQAGSGTFKTATLKVDTFTVTRTSRIVANKESISPKKSLNFYPNPGRNNLYWKGEIKAIDQIKISDLSGKTIMQASSVGIENGWDVSRISAGTYLIHFTSKGESGSRLWVKAL